MKANPQPDELYRQEYYAGEAENMAQVLSISESTSVISGSYTNCLKTKEWTPLEPGVAEHNYYAPGVGCILEVMVEGGTGHVELIKITTDDDDEDDDDDDEEG
jgi:hypothetical protein